MPRFPVIKLRLSGRTVLVLLSLFLLFSAVIIAWEVTDGPPLRLLLRYGLPSSDTPTGPVVVVQGIEFVEYGPGYRRVGSHEGCKDGNVLGLVSSLFGLDWGQPPNHCGRFCPPTWVEAPRRFRISRTSITAGQYWGVMCPQRLYRYDLGVEKECFRRHVEDYCATIASKSGERVRLPELGELVYAGWDEGVYMVPWKTGFTPAHAQRWYRDMPVAPFRGRQYSFRLVLDLTDD